MKCGFFKKDITPPNDCCLAGYPRTRKCEGIADPLHVRCVAFQEEGIAIFLCFDLIGIKKEVAAEIREYVARQIGCEAKDVFVSCTHTHTGPNLASPFFQITDYLITYLKYFAAAAAEGAIADMKEATLSYAKDTLPGISFTRRYRMKDGMVRTNPGRHNPDILEPMSPADETIQLLKITREGAGDIAIVNFQVHPDVRGGNFISADYPAVVCNTLEGALPGTSCYYMNGTAGDLNHVDVNCPEWDKNGGPEHSVHMGRTIAGKILSMYTKARPVAAGPVRTALKEVELPLRKPDPDKIPLARDYIRWYEAGEHDKIPYTGMEFTTAVLEARGILKRADGPDSTVMPVASASIGDVAIVGIPGEGFCDIGRQIRNASAFTVQLISGITNGYEGYFPMRDAFEVNGYESRTSNFYAGIAETLAEAGKELVAQLYSNK